MKSREHWSLSRQKRSSKLSLQSLSMHFSLSFSGFLCWHHSCASNVSGKQKEYDRLWRLFLYLQQEIADHLFSPEMRRASILSSLLVLFLLTHVTHHATGEWLVHIESNVIIIIIIATVIVTVVVSVIVIFIVYSLRTKLFHSAWHCRICCLCPPKFVFFLWTRGKTKITPN